MLSCNSGGGICNGFYNSGAVMCKLLVAVFVGMTLIVLVDLACHCIPPNFEVSYESRR
jgi:hypothetical protein